MRVLILEPHVSGHHGPYLQWMVQGLAEHGFDVTAVTLQESLTHPCIQAMLNTKERDSGKSHDLIQSSAAALPQGENGGAASLLARELAYWRLFRTWYKTYSATVRPDVVFLPYLDYCLYAIGLLGSPFGNCPWVGLSMRPSFHYQEMGVIAPRPSLAAIKKTLFFRMLTNRHLQCLLTIDEPLMEYLANAHGSASKVAFLPEPAELDALPEAVGSKQRLGLSIERKLILVYGSITQRKGVIELMRALADPTFPPSVDVLLAGKLSPEIYALLAESWADELIIQGRLRLLNRFIECNEEPILFAAADIVWLGYRNHYAASGVLIQAAQAGRPVLACEKGIIGWQTRRHELGEVVHPEEVSSIITGVSTLLERAPASFEGGRRNQCAAVGGAFSAAKDILVRAVTGRTQASDDASH